MLRHAGSAPELSRDKTGTPEPTLLLLSLLPDQHDSCRDHVELLGLLICHLDHDRNAL